MTHDVRVKPPSRHDAEHDADVATCATAEELDSSACLVPSTSTSTSKSPSTARRSFVPLVQLAAAFGCGILAANLKLGGGGPGGPTATSEATSTATSTAATAERQLQTGCATNFARDSSDSSPWDRLSSSERTLVVAALGDALDLDTFDSDPFEVDAVRAYEVDEPDKAAMLEYLDNGGPEPPRYARAWVYHGEGGDDHLMEYRVGPLDVAARTMGGVEPLTVPGSIPARTMMVDYRQRRAIRNAVNAFVFHPAMQRFLVDAFGDTSTIEWSMHENEMKAESSRYANIAYRRKTSQLDNILAYPLPLEFRLNMDPSDDTSQWQIVNVLYRHEYFATSNDFIRALEDSSVTIVPTKPFSSNPFWQTLDHRQTDRPNSNAAPATNVQPTKRYTVRGGRVEWLGWSFHVKNRYRTGMAIHDVSFMGDRIAYELSLQELQAIYTGRSAYMANKYLFDSVFRYGSLNRRLKAGVDCPAQATFFDNICVFELDAGIPIWRKDHQGNKFYAGAKSTQLVVRSIFPVGNYDYLVEAKFSLDGSIDMGFSATGQLYMSYYDQSEESFGTKVHDEALANVHAHFAAFKVDLDILGQNNCVEKTEVKYGPRTEILPETEKDHPDLHVPEKNMFIRRTMVTSEDEARVKINNQSPAQWKVASCSEKNRWGYHKGYDIIHPNTPLGIMDEASFNDYHMLFSQRKEHDEEFLTTLSDFMTISEPVLPVVDLTKTMDGSTATGISNGESLNNADIVAWISLGFYHVPRAEDNPVTNLVSSHFRLTPNNYFDENPSLDLGQTDRYRSGQKVEQIPPAECSVGL